MSGSGDENATTFVARNFASVSTILGKMTASLHTRHLQSMTNWSRALLKLLQTTETWDSLAYANYSAVEEQRRIKDGERFFYRQLWVWYSIEKGDLPKSADKFLLVSSVRIPGGCCWSAYRAYSTNSVTYFSRQEAVCSTFGLVCHFTHLLELRTIWHASLSFHTEPNTTHFIVPQDRCSRLYQPTVSPN